MQKLNQGIVTESVFSQLQQLKTSLFTGSLKIDTGNNLSWTIYLRLGRIVWATGGAFPFERWRRHLSIFCPDITDEYLEQISTFEGSEREYRVLTQLLQVGDPNRKQQLIDLVCSNVTEVIFDAIQYPIINRQSCSYQVTINDTIGSLFTLIPTEQACDRAEQLWRAWSSAGLSDYSPNLFLIVQQPEIIKEKAPEHIYQLIRSLADGQQNLRALALKSNRELIGLTRDLLPFIELEALAFSQVPIFKKIELPRVRDAALDGIVGLEDGGIESVSSGRLPSQSHRSSPLIVCVDDSPVVCEALNKILVPKGYRFLGIQDSIKAIPMLLKHQPDFIFLDLIMPVTNGYELCSQLRKTPNLKEVPIVILTGKDGLVDRMRAKLVGATSFISKPIKEDQVFEIIRKYVTV